MHAPGRRSPPTAHDALQDHAARDARTVLRLPQKHRPSRYCLHARAGIDSSGRFALRIRAGAARWRAFAARLATFCLACPPGPLASVVGAIAQRTNGAVARWDEVSGERVLLDVVGIERDAEDMPALLSRVNALVGPPLPLPAPPPPLPPTPTRLSAAAGGAWRSGGRPRLGGHRRWRGRHAHANAGGRHRAGAPLSALPPRHTRCARRIGTVATHGTRARSTLLRCNTARVSQASTSRLNCLKPHAPPPPPNLLASLASCLFLPAHSDSSVPSPHAPQQSLARSPRPSRPAHVPFA